MEHDPTKKIPDGEQIELFREEQDLPAESEPEIEPVKDDTGLTKEELDELYAPDPDDFLRGQR